MRTLVPIIAVSALLAAVASTAPAGAATGPRLKAFPSCASLRAYTQQHAGALPPAVARPGIQPAPAAAAGDGGAAVAHSTTNVQEPGVDEPDLAKTDGSRILAIAQGKLRYVDVSGSRPRLRGSVAIEGGAADSLLVDGDRALVFASRPVLGRALPRPQTLAPIRQGGTTLALVDLSDPDALRVVRTLTVDGVLLDARLAGSTARVVLHSAPEIPVAGAPTATVRTPGGRAKTGPLVECSHVRYPTRFSGLGLTTILTIDLRKGLQPVDTDAVMTDGQIVYSSQRHLVVATPTWVDPRVASPSATVTELHEFDVSDPDSTAYAASGEVPGVLLDQWSLSEDGGVLRVASTTRPSAAAQQESESRVTVLEERAGKLVPIGHVEGLGRGEQIVGVRFAGDVGYVVTFRRTDPLHTVDLSDPAHPRLAGKLDVLGYSAYLHPIGDGRLLTIGQDATDRGAVLGTQLSLFDVSDPARPARLDRLVLSGASSEAEFDHHAFLWWPPARLAVVPAQTANGDFTGAIGVRASAAGKLALAGRISHEGQPVRRALVAGQTLYTLSETGLAANDLATLAEEAWVPFPPSP